MQTWMDTVEELSNPALTVEAQTAPLPQRETFLGDALFPPPDEPINSVEVRGVTVRAIRPVSERREWNAPGVTIEKPAPEEFAMTIIPIEGRDAIDELEYQRLMETATTDGARRLRELLIAEIPSRIRHLAVANKRRLEIDRYNAWLEGVIRQRNPQHRSQEISVEFPWADERIEEAATAWDDAGVDAYEEALAFIKAGADEIGALEGVMLRAPLLEVIRADAPTVNGKRLTIPELEAEIASEIGQEFRFILNRAWVEPQGVKTFLFPVSKFALVPAGGAVGKTLYAPVARAVEAFQTLATLGGDDEGVIDVRGQAAYRETSNGGRHTSLEVQWNAAPLPDENLVRVIDTGVSE